MTKVNLKNMDYFKYRKYVIDGNRDETSACGKDVASLCACVQTLNFRDDEFDPGGQDWSRFDEICTGYKQILQGKRVEPLDVRIKSGWWGEQKSGLSAGKIKASLLMETLVLKSKDWMSRHGENTCTVKAGVIPLEKLVEGPGVYVFKHKERSCFQLVQSANNIFQKCSEFLKSSFEGSLVSPLTCLIVVSLVTDWDFYFVPVAVTDNEEILRVVENDLILKHDSIWPHGLNLTLTLQTTFDVIQFRRSCIRHGWPPERDFKKNSLSQLNVEEIRRENNRMFSVTSPTSASSITPPDLSPPPVNERPSSARTSTKLVHIINHPKTPRPSTAKSQLDQKKPETTGKTIQKSPTKQNSICEINKSHLHQSNKKDISRHDESIKKIKSKDCKSPEAVGNNKVVGSSSDILGGNKKPDRPTDDEFTPQQLKRSNTFTYEDDQESEIPHKEDGSLSRKADAIARFLTTQTH